MKSLINVSTDIETDQPDYKDLDGDSLKDIQITIDHKEEEACITLLNYAPEWKVTVSYDFLMYLSRVIDLEVV